MPLFKCCKCGCVENTTLGDFWTNQIEPICSECETGKWHGRFLKINATEAGYYKDSNGFLYPEDEVDNNVWTYNTTIKMIGRA